MLLPGVIPRRRLCRCARTTSAVMTPNWEPSHQHIAVGPLRRADGSEPASCERRSSNARNFPRHARRRPVACPRVVGLTRPSGRRSNVTVGAAHSDGHSVYSSPFGANSACPSQGAVGMFPSFVAASRSSRPLQRSRSSHEPIRRQSVDDHDERLAFLDDVRGKLRGVAGADVLHRVNRFGRDEQRLARTDDPRRLTVDLVLE